MEKIVIYGAGGHAGVVVDLIGKIGKYGIEGLIDDVKEPGAKISGYSVLGNGSILPDLFRSGVRYCFTSIGDNKIRRQKTELLRNAGFEPVALSHPFTSVGKGVTIGMGSILCGGAVIDPHVNIGEGVIVNCRACLGHNSDVGDFAHISAGVTCGADVCVGEGTFIGMGSTVISGIKIGKYVFVGAGSLVTKDLPDHARAVGAPARIVKS